MAVSTGASLLNIITIDLQKTKRYDKLNRQLLKGSASVIGLPLAIMGLYQLVQSVDLNAFNFDFLKDLGDFDFLNKEYPSNSDSKTATPPTSSPSSTLSQSIASLPSSSAIAETESSPAKQTSSQGVVNKGSNLPKASDSVVSALRGAETNKISFKTLYSVAGAESSFRDKVSATTSSAQGLFQFTTPTWKYLTETVFPKLGYKDEDRLDANKSAKLASMYLEMIQTSLLKGLGRLPSLGETYIGYFLGPTGAQRLIKAAEQDPTKVAAELFPSAAKANPNVFYDKGNLSKPYTLSEVVGVQTNKVEKFAQNVDTSSNEAAPMTTASVSRPATVQPVSTASLSSQPTTAAKSGEVAPYVPVYVNFKAPPETQIATADTKTTRTAGNKDTPAATKNYVRDSSNKLYIVSS
jgi:hypothetical protein